MESEQYNFRAVWFPDSLTVTKKEFDKDVDFIDAIFTNSVYFSDLTFSNKVDFGGAKFTAYASFNEVNFRQGMFAWAILKSDIHFRNCVFKDYAGFQNIVLEEIGNIYFSQTSFKGFTSFGFSILKGHIYFEGQDVTKKDANGNIRRKTLVFDGGQVSLRFGYMKPENPDKIFFRTVQLRPSWFSDIDTRKLVFSDVRWKNVDSNFTKLNVKSELENLRKIKGRNTNHFLKSVCRQLSENAENNNRFEEASTFRRMALETEWLEKKEYQIG